MVRLTAFCKQVQGLYLKEIQDRIRNFVSPRCLGLELKFNVKVRDGGPARHGLRFCHSYILL